MRNLLLLPLLGLITLTATAEAQNTTGVTRTATMHVATTNQRLKTLFGAAAPARIAREIGLYKIRYKSQNEKGQPVVLSGLLALPAGGAPRGLVVFNHGTMVDNRNSPSKYIGQANGSEPEAAVLAFATGGYAVALPDYLGLGDHVGPHPYPLGAVNSRSAVDMIVPARSASNRVGVKIAAPLYVTGYSEGGAVAMWLVRDLEKKTDPLYRVTSAAPMSGPYDLSDVTCRTLMSKPENAAQFAVQLYLMGTMVTYFHKSAGVKLTDYFRPSMAFAVAQAYKGGITEENIIKRLAVTATLMRAQNSMERVLTPRFWKVLQTLDSSDIVVRELRKSDCYDWSPRTKMLLVALQNDTVVAPQNTRKTLKTMRGRGLGPDRVRQYIIQNDQLNHVTAVPTATIQARRFFDGGFAGVKGAE